MLSEEEQKAIDINKMEKKEIYNTAYEIGQIIGKYGNNSQIKLFEAMLEDYKIKNKKVFEQKAEIEKKDKIIYEMAEKFVEIVINDDDACLLPFSDYNVNKQDIIEYFTNKVEEEIR